MRQETEITVEMVNKYIKNDPTAPKIFKCRRSTISINGHNKYLHDGMCDDCFFYVYFPDTRRGRRTPKDRLPRN